MTGDLQAAELVIRTLCPTCHGDGDVPVQDWIAYEEWARRQHIDDSDPEGEEHAVERYFLEVCGYPAVPSMREPCDDCDGAGHVDGQVPVEALVELVLEHIDRPIMATDDLQELIGHVKQAVTNAALATRGLMDAEAAAQWLRVVQEGGEALRTLRELAPGETY